MSSVFMGISNYGIQYTSPSLVGGSDDGFPDLACHIITYRNLKLDQEKESLTKEDYKDVATYLQRYSVRAGHIGFLAGVIYRIMEMVQHYFSGNSDKDKALNELHSYVEDQHRRTTDEKISEEELLARCEELLQEMLTEYNAHLTASEIRT